MLSMITHTKLVWARAITSSREPRVRIIRFPPFKCMCLHHDRSVVYRQLSNIRRTQSQNINGSRLVLQLSLPNPLKPGVNLRMKMYISWSSADRQCSNYIWVINNFIRYYTVFVVCTHGSLLGLKTQTMNSMVVRTIITVPWYHLYQYTQQHSTI